MIDVSVLDQRENGDLQEAFFIKDFYEKIKTEFPNEVGMVNIMIQPSGKVRLHVMAMDEVVTKADDLFERLQVELEERRNS